jgi:acyl carrier protein
MENLLEDPDRLSPASAFHEDIEMPELLDVELTMAVEEGFKLSIPDEDASNIRTLGELVEYVRERLHA